MDPGEPETFFRNLAVYSVWKFEQTVIHVQNIPSLPPNLHFVLSTDLCGGPSKHPLAHQ
jgi:hypothetical protein